MKTKDKVLGAGIGLAAVAAAGTYFLYGKHGAENREAIKGWAVRMKGEVLHKLEHLKDVNQAAYNEIVDETAQRYGRTKRVSASELRHITGELKNAWGHIAEQLKGART
jgi:gas vesicle protein